MNHALPRAARVLAAILVVLLVLTVLPSALRLAFSGVPFGDYPPPEAVYLGPGDVVRQREDADCGLAALLTLLHRSGIWASYPALAARLPASERSPDGISLRALADLGSSVGLPLDGYRLRGFVPAPAPLPWIAHVRGGRRGHYLVVDQLTARAVILSDPAVGRLELSRAAFARIWSGYVLVPRQSPTR